jgi:hypothetical protein
MKRRNPMARVFANKITPKRFDKTKMASSRRNHLRRWEMLARFLHLRHRAWQYKPARSYRVKRNG